MQADAADVEVLLEAVQLKEVGEFKSPDVAAPLADLALEVAHDAAEVIEGITGAQEFEPGAFAIKAQAHALAGQLAVEGVSLGDVLRGDGVHGEGDEV